MHTCKHFHSPSLIWAPAWNVICIPFIRACLAAVDNIDSTHLSRTEITIFMEAADWFIFKRTHFTLSILARIAEDRFTGNLRAISLSIEADVLMLASETDSRECESELICWIIVLWFFDSTNSHFVIRVIQARAKEKVSSVTRDISTADNLSTQK